MAVYPIDYEKLTSLTTTYDANKPIYMLNLLRFREKAEYAPEHAELAGTPCTGREAWTRYVTALHSGVLPPESAVFFMSKVTAMIAGPQSEQWDDAAIVYYPTLEGFKNMVESKVYKEKCFGHRFAALEDFRLVMLDKM
ncbi:hypothetical protein EJ04DRAFT_572642 [Polyplosphaeria fusca]|uniref:DUF1330 domain-containing protein n=1 Tax=Polyplosphaeria fusca TaxID=682080 RepID=A0A9P4R6B9_9PLEO|nr:hypothetical protein EJ04DRAFT_572642 [Polyplosphaeria fusca]